MDHLVRDLAHIGIPEKEAAVYLAALELGPAAVQEIARKSKVNRATTYVMVESLIARGMMSSFVRGKKRQYAAESPDRLRAILATQRRELEQKQVEFEGVFPMLSALFNAEGAKPQIRSLEGTEGVRTVRALFEKLDGEVLQFSPYEPVASRVDDLADGREGHLRQMTANRVPYRVLMVMEDPDLSRLPALPNLEARLVPRDRFPTDAEITIRGNTICLYSFKTSVLATVITNQELADAFRSLFELAWKGAEGFPARKT